ncbi:arginyl-tRNA--protein transferase 1-like isoform X2 [Pecten maximus]|uniref:arginyl-tRNA--protein transferase 1-like isoform X2 n=1 Tax=Pecten maximus TaxID=6579 RepID=UPI001458827C|nr:arginyl-tRNA--protein transferase 1-like isoform X2 [Pecten maximus]
MEGLDPSIVEYSGASEKQRCTYCARDGSRFHGMWSDSLNVQEYQTLLDRGWRRRGHFFYKPTMDTTCCPQYTIRMDAMNFKLSKSHKKVLKQMNKYLMYGQRKGKSQESHEEKPEPEPERKVDQCPIDGQTEDFTHVPVTKSPPTAGMGADPNKPAMRKAKHIRLEKRRQRELMNMQRLSAGDGCKTAQRYSKGIECQEDNKGSLSTSGKKTLSDFICEPDRFQKCVHKFEVRLIRPTPKSREFLETETESAEIFKQYRTTIHNYPPDESERNEWLNYLVHSPLKQGRGKEGPSMGYGTFHQHYILDGKLIAVGVLDILPYCVLSVYLYYLPEYRFLSIGTYTALREIAFVQELNKTSPDLRYYYMGYYVHSCSKITYKSHYSPSFLLCPETYTWIPVSGCIPKLGIREYSRLATEGVEDSDRQQEVDNIPVLFCGQIMTFGNYTTLHEKTPDVTDVMEYGFLVGSRCVQKLLLVRK